MTAFLAATDARDRRHRFRFRWRQSVRIRLALWHTATLAVLLAAFAVSAYVFLVRVMQRHADRELVETARTVSLAWRTKQSANGLSAAAAATEVMNDVRNRDLRVLMFDGRLNLIGVSDTARLTPHLPIASLTGHGASAIAPLLQLTAPGRPAFATIGEEDGWVRVAVVRLPDSAGPFTVVVLRDTIADEDVMDTFQGWVLAAIPLVLVLSGIGGYALARASLMPMVAMGSQAQRISATSLGERLFVANPDDELGQLAGILNGLLDRLERAFTQQQQFMADASHELRTPVTVVRSVADVALDRADPSPRDLQEALRLISTESRRMTRIVDDLFLLARADAGQQPVRRARHYLEEVLVAAVGRGRVLGRERGVTVVALPADEAPFDGDEALLGRMLLNLVDNAVKHSPDGGAVRLTLLTVNNAVLPTGIVLKGNWYRCSVQDEGSGVDPSVLDTLFERFVRAGEPSTLRGDASAPGAGLGLAIARWIASAHAGHVELEETGVVGTRFVVWLPAEA